MDLVSNFIFDDMCEKIFPYLDHLRDESNMSGGQVPRSIMEEFDINHTEAIKVLWAWEEKEKK
tara:strand:+ start:1139 stop:1327 length:189 start_codon:yes stop_codon:yes gene_type:complete